MTIAPKACYGVRHRLLGVDFVLVTDSWVRYVRRVEGCCGRWKSEVLEVDVAHKIGQ